MNEQVRAGAAPDAATLVNVLLRALSADQRVPFATSPELEQWLLESADSPVNPLTPSDFDGIRNRVRARLAR